MPSKRNGAAESTPTTPTSSPRFYTTADLAELFCTTRYTIEYWRKRHRYTGPLGVVIGRRVLYPRAAVDAMITQAIRDQAPVD